MLSKKPGPRTRCTSTQACGTDDATASTSLAGSSNPNRPWPSSRPTRCTEAAEPPRRAPARSGSFADRHCAIDTGSPPFGMSPALASEGTIVLVRLDTKSCPDIGFSVCVIADQTILPLFVLHKVVSNFTN
jgi:hypothetical protein